MRKKIIVALAALVFLGCEGGPPPRPVNLKLGSADVSVDGVRLNFKVAEVEAKLGKPTERPGAPGDCKTIYKHSVVSYQNGSAVEISGLEARVGSTVLLGQPADNAVLGLPYFGVAGKREVVYRLADCDLWVKWDQGPFTVTSHRTSKPDEGWFRAQEI